MREMDQQSAVQMYVECCVNMSKQMTRYLGQNESNYQENMIGSYYPKTIWIFLLASLKYLQTYMVHLVWHGIRTNLLR